MWGGVESPYLPLGRGPTPVPLPSPYPQFPVPSPSPTLSEVSSFFANLKMRSLYFGYAWLCHFICLRYHTDLFLDPSAIDKCIHQSPYTIQIQNFGASLVGILGTNTGTDLWPNLRRASGQAYGQWGGGSNPPPKTVDLANFTGRSKTLHNNACRTCALESSEVSTCANNIGSSRFGGEPPPLTFFWLQARIRTPITLYGDPCNIQNDVNAGWALQGFGGGRTEEMSFERFPYKVSDGTEVTFCRHCSTAGNWAATEKARLPVAERRVRQTTSDDVN